MKRSDAIKSMQDAREYCITNYIQEHKIDAYVLFKLEKAGMLPPIIPEMQDCYIDISCHTGESIEDFYKWEKEND